MMRLMTTRSESFRVCLRPFSLASVRLDVEVVLMDSTCAIILILSPFIIIMNYGYMNVLRFHWS